MAEWNETRDLASRGNADGAAASWLAFMVGTLLIAVVAVFMLNTHARIDGPTAHLSFSSISAIETPAIPAPHN